MSSSFLKLNIWYEQDLGQINITEKTDRKFTSRERLIYYRALGSSWVKHLGHVADISQSAATVANRALETAYF
ncbi:hypothetical protein SISSUDRAFT_1060070 [Sistotremastrum suecicum HHB10207 ss-3]|uniref:Uncharacterized protein n=1 Tax=Sistotremastrum suecicum HHB10207 ss-3 TaxID=1314776 RepID=A0A166FJS8_9AGAM|nr:hypothetical protein SISSUDRAFT_1060070 [Sistotremastrum suecicum HHB10207 ss-3]